MLFRKFWNTVEKIFHCLQIYQRKGSSNVNFPLSFLQNVLKTCFSNSKSNIQHMPYRYFSNIKQNIESRRSFSKTSSRRLPGDLLKTFLRCLKTSRLFLVRAKDHLETKYGLSIYGRFKLLTYYHFITRQTNWINLNKINTLKHGNNTEIMKTRC